MTSSRSGKIQVIRFEQSGHPLMIGVMEAERIIRHTTVDRYDPAKPVDSPKQGYQRPEDKPRVKKFANYLRKTYLPLVPTSVLLSSRGVELNYDPETGTIELTNGDKLHVVDGQHRVAGYRHAIEEKKLDTFRKFPVPFVVMVTADKIEEMKQFRTVNGEQKGVRTDLVNTILGQLVASKGEDAISESQRWKVIATYAVDILNGDAGSPWFDRITKPGVSRYSVEEMDKKPELEHRRLVRATSFVASLHPVINFLQGTGFLQGTMKEQAAQLAEIVRDFWQAIRNGSPEMFDEGNFYVIQKTPGVFSLHMILPDLLRDMYRARRDWSVGNFEEMLEDLPSVTNSAYWHIGDKAKQIEPGHASAFGSMKGFAQLAALLREEREDALSSTTA